MMKRVGMAFALILMLYGAISLGRGAYTLYTDYQDFKLMRIWITAKVKQEQQLIEQRKKAAQQAPTPAPVQQPEQPR